MLKKIAKKNKKNCAGPPPFFKPLEELFFPLVPQRKKNCSRGGGPGQIFLFFWQFFSTCEKITQILEFSRYQGVKI